MIYLKYGRLGLYGPRKRSKFTFDKATDPALKLANHTKSAHAGVSDPKCFGCNDLQRQIENRKVVTDGI